MSGRTAKPKSMAYGRPDDFQTPPEALEPLLPHLQPGWTIWEPSCGRGNLVSALEARGHRVIGSDIKDGRDFLLWAPGEPWDAILTNPPYSLKQQFLQRAYALGRPFAFLLPLTTLETATRQRLFARYGVEIILMPSRVDFQTPSGKGSSAWFATAWFTSGLSIGRQLSFWRAEEEQGVLGMLDELPL